MTNTFSRSRPIPSGRWRRPILGSDIRLTRRIALGEAVTGTYAMFCRRRHSDYVAGVFIPGQPDPLPYRRPIQCAGCGEVFEADAVHDDPTANSCVLTHHWDSSECHGDRTRICPQCGDVGRFRPAVRCAACRTFPCTCPIEDRLEEQPYANPST